MKKDDDRQIDDDRQVFEQSPTRRNVDKSFKSWGEEPLNGLDELRIAYVAYNARRTEILPGTFANLVAFAAIGVAALTITTVAWWQLASLILVAGAAMYLGLLTCELGGIRAATQAVVDHRQAVKLANASGVPRNAAPTQVRANTATMLAGAVGAVAGAVLVTVASRRRRG